MCRGEVVRVEISSLGVLTEKQCLCKIFGGQTKSIMVCFGIYCGNQLVRALHRFGKGQGSNPGKSLGFL